MTNLERKVTNAILAYTQDQNHLPKFAEVTIRWNDDKEYVRNVIIALYPYDCDNEDNDDRIFFYLDEASSLLSLLANIDFIADDFDEKDDFFAEVDKYDTDDEDDYSILHRGEDFCIVDVTDFFDEI